MNKLHQRLLEKYPGYRSWHENPASNTLHFAVLVMVPVLFFLSISSGINDTLSQLGSTGTAVFSPGSNANVISQQAKNANNIVRARVESATSFEETNSYGDHLFMTQIVANVTENLKGNANGKIKVDMVGGTVDGITMKSSNDGEPLTPGEEAVIFLKPGETNDFKVSGGENGVYRIKNNEIVGKKGVSLNDLKSVINSTR